MEEDIMEAAIEAILFSAGDPVSISRIAGALEIEKNKAEKITNNIIQRLEDEGRGIRVIRVRDAYQMCSKAEYGEYVRKCMKVIRSCPLSPAAMEVLSIIAYRQPVTKAFVDNVRGVDCREIINGLCEKNLVMEKGRLDIPGKPIIFGTTDTFLRCLGVRSIDELAPLPENLKESI